MLASSGSTFHVLMAVAVLASIAPCQLNIGGNPRLPSLVVTGVPQPSTVAMGDGFGASVVSPGDINGDGVHDLIVGAPLAAVVGFFTNGRIEAVDGATGSVLWAMTGIAPSQRLGDSVSLFPDFDGDQIDDVLVATTVNDVVKVRIYASVAGPGASAPSLLAEVDVAPAASPFVQYRSLAAYAFRDTTGDGVPEVVVIGAPEFDYVVDMVTQTNVAMLPLVSTTTGLFRLMAHGRVAVTDADLTGDGIPDLVVGRPGLDRSFVPLIAAGQIAAFDGVTFQPLWTLTGSLSYGQLGASLLNVGDVNSDGVPDLVAGAPHVNQYAGYTSSGSIMLIDGATGATLQTFIPVAPSIPAGIERFGTSLALLPSSPANERFGRLIVGCGSDMPIAGQAATIAVRLNVGGTGITHPNIGGTYAFQTDGAYVGEDHGGVVEVLQLNNDSSADVVIGLSRGAAPSAVSGSLQLYRMPGEIGFGAGPPSTHTLTVEPSPSFALSLILVSGGGPGNPCFIGASLSRASASLPVAGGEVLIDVFDPSFVLLPTPAPFNAQGNALFPLGGPSLLPLSGLTWFTQALELSATAPQGAYFSDGWQVTL